MLRLTVPGAVLACLWPALAQAQEINVSKIIHDLAQRAEDARAYSFEGDLLLSGQLGAEPGKILAQARVRLAAGPDGKSFLNVNAPAKGEYLLLSDGQKSWAYVPKLKQYTEEESGARPDDADTDGQSTASGDQERDPAESYARLVMPILARMYKSAASANRIGEATVKFAGKKQKWPLVRVFSKKDEQEGASMTELALDPGSLNIGRLVWANLTDSGGQKTVVRLTIDFRSFQIGDALPDATFHFTPPKNAKLVDAVPIPGQSGSFLLNRPAPDFELKTLDGQRVRLDSLRGKPVLLSFFASWCAPCLRELPGLVRIYEEFKGQGLEVLGVNDEGKGTARRFADKVGLSFTILDDSGEKAYRLYRVWNIPMTFLIDRDGKVVRFLRGGRDYQSLRTALKAVGL